MSMECKQYKLRENPVITAIQFDRSKIDEYINNNDTKNLIRAIISLRDSIVDFLGINIDDFIDTREYFDILIFDPYIINNLGNINRDFIRYDRVFGIDKIKVAISIGVKCLHNGDYIVKYNNCFHDIIPEEEFKAKYEEVSE